MHEVEMNNLNPQQVICPKQLGTICMKQKLVTADKSYKKSTGIANCQLIVNWLKTSACLVKRAQHQLMQGQGTDMDWTLHTDF